MDTRRLRKLDGREEQMDSRDGQMDGTGGWTDTVRVIQGDYHHIIGNSGDFNSTYFCLLKFYHQIS